MSSSSRIIRLVLPVLALIVAGAVDARGADTAADSAGEAAKILSVIGGDTMKVVEISIDDDRLELTGADGKTITIRVKDLDDIGELRALVDSGQVVISDEDDSIRFHVGGKERARFKRGGIVRVETEGSDLVRVGDSIEVEEDEVIDGDAVAVGGSARVAGTVNGDVVAIGGSIHLESTAHVRGEVVCVGGKIQRDPGSEVGGEVVQVGPGFPLFPGAHKHHHGGLRTATKVFFLMALMLSLATMIVVSIWGTRIQGMAAIIPTETTRLGLTGLVAWMLAPWACLLLVITCVGIIFVPLFVVLFGFAIIAGLTAVYLTAGEWVSRRRFAPAGPVRTALVGLLAIHGVAVIGAFIGGFIPFLKPIGIAVFVFGLVLVGLAATIGLGAVLYTRFGKRHIPVPPPLPSSDAGPAGLTSGGVGSEAPLA